MKPRILVLRAPGSNCDQETAAAWRYVGGEAELVHVNALVRGEMDLLEYQILTIPGGFTYGDDLGAGKLLANDFLYPDPFNLVVFPDNHDMSRFYMQVGMDQDLYKLGITYILTTRGIPQIFYGSEILMTHTESNSHGDIRKDFPGGWEGDRVNGFTGENLTEDEKAMQAFFRKLLHWRKDNLLVQKGKLIH